MEGKIPHAPNFEKYLSEMGELETVTSSRNMSSKDGKSIDLHRTYIGLDGVGIGKYSMITIKNGVEDTVVDQMYDGKIPGMKIGNTKNMVSLLYTKLNYWKVGFYGTDTGKLTKNLVSFVTNERNYNERKSLMRLDSHDIPFP